LLATGLVEIKNGQAKRRTESYEEYVDELEKQLEQAIADDNKSREKDNEAQNKYLENKANQKIIKNLEKELDKLKQQETKLINYFLHNPNSYDINKVKELEETKITIKDKEDKWLRLSL